MRIARLLVVVLALAGRGVSASAQSALPGIDITLPRDTLTAKEGPTITASQLLRDAKAVTQLNAGFPTRLSYRLELWRQGGFLGNTLEQAREWEVRIQYEPASKLYRVYRGVGTVVTELGHDSTLAAVEAIVDRPFAVVLGPTHTGERYYYDISLAVTSLTGSDVDQTVRWLQGDPGSEGKGNLFTSIKTGLFTLAARVLGRKSTYERTSALFTAG